MIQINTSNYSQLVFSTSTPQANFEFFTDSGTIVPAWIESYTSPTLTVWVKLVNGIAANSTATIYLGIGSSSANFLSSAGTSGIGIAPQLTSTYGQYDNGTNVFNNYWNFAGTSLSSGINIYTNAGSVIFNNGIIIKGGTSATGGENGIATSTSFSPPVIVEYYGTQSTSPTSDSWGYNTSGFSNYLSATYSYSFNSGTYTNLNFEGGNNGLPHTSQGGSITYGTLSTPSNNLFSASVWTHIYASSTYYTYQNYTNSTGYITGATNTASLPFAIICGNNEASYASNGMTVYYLRSRAYPPSGTAPTNTFGSVIYNIYIDTIKFRYGLQLSDYIEFRYGLQINPNIKFRYGLQLSDYIKFRYGLQTSTDNIKFRYGLQAVSTFNFNNYL